MKWRSFDHKLWPQLSGQYVLKMLASSEKKLA
jgi:hypothetical protein